MGKSIDTCEPRIRIGWPSSTSSQGQDIATERCRWSIEGCSCRNSADWAFSSVQLTWSKTTHRHAECQTRGLQTFKHVVGLCKHSHLGRHLRGADRQANADRSTFLATSDSTTLPSHSASCGTLRLGTGATDLRPCTHAHQVWIVAQSMASHAIMKAGPIMEHNQSIDQSIDHHGTPDRLPAFAQCGVMFQCPS